MVGLDTNVVVRYLTQDDPKQCSAVNALFDRAARSEEPAFQVNVVVLAEVVWVLESVYSYARSDIAKALTLLLAVRQIEIAAKQVAKAALDAFAAGNADFADYLISALDRESGCEATLTFDRKAATVTGFSLLTATR